MTPAIPRWRPALALLGFAALLAGFVLDRTWTALPREARIADVLILAFAAAAIAVVARKWPGWQAATTVAACTVAGVVVFAGPMPVLATLLLGLAAIGVGTLVTAGGLSLPIGLALVAATVGWLLPLGVHAQWIHATVLAAIVLLRRRAVLASLRTFRAEWSSAVAEAPWAAALAALAMLVASFGCWLPTMQYDDLTYHLGLPYQLQETGRYALDPDQQVWALAPWAGDVLQAVAQVIAGQEARGAVNALWLLVAGVAIHRVTGLAGARAWARWAAVGVVATVPLTMTLAAGMQTELPGMAVTVSLAWAAWHGLGTPTRSAVGGGILFGLLCGLKIMHVVTALPLMLWAAARHRQALGFARAAAAAAAAVTIGGSSYAYAWIVAGNPVLPLQNEWFRSSYFPAEDFLDTRWTHGFAADLPWRITFDTASFFEGTDGALGFILVALSGAWLLSVANPRTRGLALAAAAGLVLALLPMQYARYLYPSVSLLGAVAVVALDGALRKPLAAGLLLALCVLQAAFVGSGYWMLRDGAIREAVLAAGADAPLYPGFAPERLLLARMRASSSPPAGAVLVMGAQPDALAELGTRGRTTSWYSHRLSRRAAQADADASGAGWVALAREEGVTDIVLRDAGLSAPQRKALAQLGAYRVDAVGVAEWWRLP